MGQVDGRIAQFKIDQVIFHHTGVGGVANLFEQVKHLRLQYSQTGIAIDHGTGQEGDRGGAEHLLNSAG